MERSSVQNKVKRKPQLIIETNETMADMKSFKRKPLHRNEVEIKPLMSAKNRHELKNAFQFPPVTQNPFNFLEKQQVKMRALQRLESQKTELMKSLQILKQGAVSAIIEKEEEIQKLKEHIHVQKVLSIKSIQKEREEQEEQRFNNRLTEKELQLKEIYRKQLEEEVEELRKQLRKERIRYESELYQKEEMISSLCVQLNDSYHKIDQLEKGDDLLQEKLKNIELQNMSLLKELQTSQLLNSSHSQLNTSFFLNISNVTNKSRIKSLASDQIFSEDAHNFGDLSYASTIPIKKHSENMFLYEDQDHLSNSFISQRIESIKEKHKKEVENIKGHYQLELSRLKKKYQGENSRQESEGKGQNSVRSRSGSGRKNSDNDIMHLNLKRIGSVESFQSAGNSTSKKYRDDDQDRTSSYNTQNNKTLSRYKAHSYSNLTKGQIRQLSLQGIFIQEKMQSIIERGEYDEAGTPRYSLKQEILQQEMYPSSSTTSHHDSQYRNHNYDAITTVSNLQNYFNNKNSSQKNLLNSDTLSQFTANHFEYPMNPINQREGKPFLRTNSIATFEGEIDESKSTGMKKFQSLQEKLGALKLNIGGNSNQKDQILEKSPSKIISVDDSQGESNSKFHSHYKHQPSQTSEQDDKLSTRSKASSKKSSKSSLKKDIMMFCFGLVTGGTLIGMGNKILNK